MPKTAQALKNFASFSLLAALLSTSACAMGATPILSEPHRAFCRAPGLSWSVILDFDKFDSAKTANGNDGESELSFLSGTPSEVGQLAREASYHVLVRKVSQFPEINFDSYRVVFGEESSNFILSLPRDRKGKSILSRAYLSTDGQTQTLACTVSLREPDALAKALATDLERAQNEARVSDAQLPPQVCAIDYLDEKSQQYEFGCSATVVSPRDLLTAGHCQNIYHDRPARARCPGQPVIAIDLKNSAHHEKHVEDMWKVSYDIAILRLTKPVTTTPAEIAPSTASVQQAIFDHPESCALYGYGRELDGHLGRLHGVRFEFPPEDLGGRAFTETNFSDEHMISTDPRLFLRGGDSGGPILCAGTDGSAPMIVGVHSILFSLDSSANSSSVGFNSAWINDHLFDDENSQDAVARPELTLQASVDQASATDSGAAPAAGSGDASGATSGATRGLPDDEAPIHIDGPVKLKTDSIDDAPIVESSDTN